MKLPMKPRLLSSPRGGARGLTLVELMISLVIGLILMIAIVSAYLGSSGASRMAEAQGRMNEDGQAALSILAQQLRMAGNNPKQPNYTKAMPRNPVYDTTTYIVRGCDGTFSNINTAGVTIPNLTCAAGGGAAPDSIAISYEADRYNTTPTPPTAPSPNLPTDCLGQALAAVAPAPTPLIWNGGAAVATAVTVYMADNRFYVGRTAVVKSPSLYCKGSGGANPQPLVENIEDLQFTYGTGLAAATSTLTVSGYLTAADILTDANLAALPDDPARWSKVMTVRICVLVRSEQPLVSDAASAQYIKCDGTLENNPPDLRLRRTYSTTVVLRNRISGQS